MGAAPPLAQGTQPVGPAGASDALAVAIDAAAKPSGISPRGRARIALLPTGARRARGRLLEALELAYPVRFEEPPCAVQELAENGFDGVLTIGDPWQAALSTSLPHLCALGDEHPREGAVSEIALAAHEALARPLRGARLTDSRIPPIPRDTLTEFATGHVVLATTDGSPAWVLVRGAEDNERLELLAAAPAELAPGEALRERLAPGRCLALLALVHFVRRVVNRASTDGDGEDPPPAPPLHAAFVLDDPNLHSPRYGHLRYAELARHADAHGYHMVIAMPPIDGWFAHPRAVRIFREHAPRLSLCIHGNDHLGGELGRVRTAVEGLELGRQALARAATFERRTGIPFERVMVPPHEQLTEPAARGLREAGFAATCVSRPYPWIAPERPGPAAALSTGPAERGPVAGWEPCELVAGGLPMLLRTGFNAPREDLVLRAFLGQPLIVYGHHDTLAHSLDELAATTAAIDALGEIRWGSLATVAQGVVPASTSAGNTVSQIDASHLATHPRLRPLLRRLASEARDRARV